jgi:hypothetical protein
MKLKMIVGALVLTLMGSFAAFAATADDEGRIVCQQAGWIGTYLTPVQSADGKHFADQLQFNPGGSITFSGSYYPEKMISEGTTSQGVGTWECRKDGTIAATILFASFSGDGNDLSLIYHARATMIFTFLNETTIRRDVLAVRLYFSDADPTDPEAGFIVNLPPAQPEYRKLGVNLSDLGL